MKELLVNVQVLCLSPGQDSTRERGTGDQPRVKHRRVIAVRLFQAILHSLHLQNNKLKNCCSRVGDRKHMAFLTIEQRNINGECASEQDYNFTSRISKLGSNDA